MWVAKPEARALPMVGLPAFSCRAGLRRGASCTFGGRPTVTHKHDPMRFLGSFLLVCFAAANTHAFSREPRTGSSENVLLIVADDLGVDYVGCYAEGTNPPPTPNIDALADDGVLFRNAWAYPSCSPTRASLLTGRYPFRTLVGRWIAHNDVPPTVGLLRFGERTLPELLDAGATGHAHALIGKWHLGNVASDPDEPRTIGGFDHFAGLLEGQIPDYQSWTHVVDGVSAPTTTYCTIQNTDDALAWIAQQSGPWTCVLTYQAPHVPYHVPPANLHTQSLSGPPTTQVHTSQNRPYYRAMVESLDTEIGRLMNSLGTSVLDATNVIFVGDNGSVQQQAVAPFNPGRAKGTPFEGGINVPLIVSGPAVNQPGREVGHLVCAVDLFETALNLAGTSAPPGVQHDSVSLAPYLADPQQASLRSFAYSEQFTGTTWPSPEQSGYAICRDDRYKLIDYQNGTTDRLYDLVADPFENVNLITSSNPAHVTAEAELRAEIARLRGTYQPIEFQVFGTSTCVGSNGLAPRISATGSTSPGQTFSVHLDDAAPFKPALFAMGSSSSTWLGLPLPLSLVTLNADPACMLSSSAQDLYVHLTGPTGSAVRFLTVPSDPSLVGLTRYAAWVVLDAGIAGNPAGYVSSLSVAMTVN